MGILDFLEGKDIYENKNYIKNNEQKRHILYKILDFCYQTKQNIAISFC